MRKLMILLIMLFISTPTVFSEALGEFHLTYKITGEITNLNPYSVFIAMPDGQVVIEDSGTLPAPSGVIQANLIPSENITYYHIKPDLTTFNKKAGFWLPPYTTTKIKLAVYDYNISIDVSPPTEYDYRVVEPIVANTYKILKIERMFPYASKEHIKLGNFKLYVDGYLEIYRDAGALSVVLPLPIVLDKYEDFYMRKDKKAPDVWVNYYDWYYNFINTKNYYLMKELEKEMSDFDPMISDDFSEFDFKQKEFPAMVFTVNEGGGKIEFYYTMEWEGNKEISVPDII
jgi:hypothetical protein